MTAARPRIQGFALIELLMTITVLTVLLALCAGMIHLLVRLDRASHDALDIASDQTRLGTAWRADVHRAAVNPPPALTSDRLTLTLPDANRVVYSIGPNDLVREVHQGDRLQRREVYRRPPHATARFEATAVANRPFLTLVIHRDLPNARTATNLTEPDARVEAEVGRLDRWAGRTP